jgi:hypothetical protein
MHQISKSRESILQIKLTLPRAATDRAEKLMAGDWKARPSQSFGRCKRSSVAEVGRQQKDGDGVVQGWEKRPMLDVMPALC